MTIVLVLSVALLIALTVTLVMLLSKKTLEGALVALLGMLTSLVTALSAPSVEGNVDAAMDLGALGHLTFSGLRANSPLPSALWYTGFGGVTFLSAVALVLVYLKTVASRAKTTV